MEERIERFIKHVAVEVDATPEQTEKLTAIAKGAARDGAPQAWAQGVRAQPLAWRRRDEHRSHAQALLHRDRRDRRAHAGRRDAIKLLEAGTRHMHARPPVTDAEARAVPSFLAAIVLLAIVL